MISSDTIVVTDMPENSVVVGNPEKKSPKYNPQIQKSGETKTKGSKSDKNRAESQFQAVIEIESRNIEKVEKKHQKLSKPDALFSYVNHATLYNIMSV